MVGQRKVWGRESGVIRVTWQFLYQERWNWVGFFWLEKRRSECGGTDVFGVMNAVGKVQLGIVCSLLLPVQKSRGNDLSSPAANRPVNLLTEGCCVPKKLQEETGEALGRGTCCGWQNRETTAGAGFPPGLRSVAAETLLGMSLAVLALRDTLPRGVPTYGAAGGRVPGWQDPAPELPDCSDALSCCEEGNSLRYVVRYHNA